MLPARHRSSTKSHIHDPSRPDIFDNIVNREIPYGSQRYDEMDFLVVDGVLVGMPTDIFEMEKESSQIDLGGQYVYFTIYRNSARVGFKPDSRLNKPAGY